MHHFDHFSVVRILFAANGLMRETIAAMVAQTMMMMTATASAARATIGIDFELQRDAKCFQLKVSHLLCDSFSKIETNFLPSHSPPRLALGGKRQLRRLLLPPVHCSLPIGWMSCFQMNIFCSLISVIVTATHTRTPSAAEKLFQPIPFRKPENNIIVSLLS